MANTITLHGNLTTAAEVKTAATNGKQYWTATVASDRAVGKDARDAGTDFFPIVAFGKHAEEIAALNLAKGDFIKVTGSMRLSRYSDDNKLSVSVVARRVERPVRKEKAA